MHDAAVNASKKKMFIVPGGDHNNTFLLAGAQSYIKVEESINECLGKPASGLDYDKVKISASQEEAPELVEDEIKDGKEPEAANEEVEVKEEKPKLRQNKVKPTMVIDDEGDEKEKS